MTVPARRPEDDALDRLERNPHLYEPQNKRDLATVREALERLRSVKAIAQIKELLERAESAEAEAQRLRDQAKFCPYCAGAFVPETDGYEGPCEGCKIAERLRDRRDALELGRNIAEEAAGWEKHRAESAEAEVRQLREREQNLRGELRRSDLRVRRLAEGLREWKCVLCNGRGYDVCGCDKQVCYDWCRSGKPCRRCEGSGLHDKARALLSANPPQGDAAEGSSPSDGDCEHEWVREHGSDGHWCVLCGAGPSDGGGACDKCGHAAHKPGDCPANVGTGYFGPVLCQCGVGCGGAK